MNHGVVIREFSVQRIRYIMMLVINTNLFDCRLAITGMIDSLDRVESLT